MNFFSHVNIKNSAAEHDLIVLIFIIVIDKLKIGVPFVERKFPSIKKIIGKNTSTICQFLFEEIFLKIIGGIRVFLIYHFKRIIVLIFIKNL